MSKTEQLQDLGDFLWELLTDEPPSLEEQQQQLTDRLVDALEQGGFRGISNEELADALGEVQHRLIEQNQADLNDLSVDMGSNLHDVSLNLHSSLSQDFDEGIASSIHQLKVEQIEPLKVAIANRPTPVVNQVTHRHVTNVTNIDDRQVVNTNNVVNDGGVLDQRIIQSDDGSIAVGGDVNDSALNSGTVDGVQAAGDVDVEDSTIGDDNIAIEGEIDNAAVGGDIVDIDVAPPEPAPEPEPLTEPEPVVVEPVVEEVVDSGFDDAAAAEAEAAAIEAELDV